MKLIIFLALLLILLQASSFEEIKTFVKNDQCALENLETLRPKIHNQIQKLKENPNNVLAKAELLLLVQKAQEVFTKCDISKKVEPLLGDAVKAAGIGFLLGSNCFKDVGAVLLISDDIIQDPSDVVDDIVILIFVALLGRQSYADCSQFIGYIL